MRPWAGARGTCPNPTLEEDFWTGGAHVTHVFSCGRHGRQQGARGTGPLLKHIKMAVDCSGVARNFEPEGHKGPRHFLVGDMRARGRGQGAPAPNPPPEFKNVLISVAYSGFLG